MKFLRCGLSFSYVHRLQLDSLLSVRALIVVRRDARLVTQWLSVGLLALGTLNTAHAVTCAANFSPANPDSAYTVHGDGTATDTRSGLRWKVCSEGQTWDAGACTGSATTHTWTAAVSLAETSNYAATDWRLPNVKELRSLVEECRSGPAINDSIFPNTPSSLQNSSFWSGSPDVGGSIIAYSQNIYARSVRFDFGYANRSERRNVLNVRLVQTSRPLNAVLPTGDVSTARVMRGGRGYRWFQVRDASGTPLSGADVTYRYVRDGDIAGATTQTDTTDANGLLVVSTPPLDYAGLGQVVTALGQEINFELIIDQVAHTGNPVLLSYTARPFKYVVAARNMEQKWNVGAKAAITASAEPQLGLARKVGVLGAKARAGFKLSGTGEYGMSFGWTHSVNNYGGFEIAGYDYGLITQLNALALSIDEEITVKGELSGELRAGWGSGVGKPGFYFGAGADAEMSGTFGLGVSYAFPTFFAPAGAGPCAMGWATLSLGTYRPSFVERSLSSVVCGNSITTYQSSLSTKLAVAATVGASAFASTRQLNMKRRDRDFGQHFFFAGVSGDVAATYERERDIASQASTVTKTLFAKGSLGIELSPFSEMRGKARGSEKILRSTTFGLNRASVGEYTKKSRAGADGVATSVAFSAKSAEIQKNSLEFESFSLSTEEQVAEITTIYSRSSVDALALSEGWMIRDIEFSRSPIVLPVEQALQTSTGLGGGFTTAPGYYIERTSASTPRELEISIEGKRKVKIAAAITFAAEQITNSLSERGRVASFLSPSGQRMYAPLKTESYVADGELASLRREPTEVSAAMKAALQDWFDAQVTSIQNAIDSVVRSVSNAASELRALGGTYLFGWHFVLTKENPSMLLTSKLSTLLLNASGSAVIGQVHFVNLLSPTNEDVDAFPDPVNLTIGNVLAALSASGLASSDASALVLVRIDRASGKTVVVPGTLGAGGDSYVAGIQQRGAYFLVYDRTPPSLTLLVASTTSNSPKTVTVAGAFDGSDLTGLNPATFSVVVDGVEQGAPVSGVSKINSTTGEFKVPVTSGAWTSGSVSRLQVRIADGAGNISLTSRCAYPTGSDMALLPSTSATCSALATGAVNITASAAPDRQTDAVLLARYLLGFRGGALTSGLTLTGTRTLPADIAAFIGDARVFDVVARDPADSPRAMVDALILLRLAQGFADAQLLEGITVPAGAGLTTAAGIRAFVNLKFGTNY